MMKINKIIFSTIAGISSLCILASCEEKGLLVNDNDISYVRFTKDMAKDTTTVSFKVYNEGEQPEIPIEVAVYGKIQDEDLEFSVSVDESRTTLPADLYDLPEKCVIKKGQLLDTIYVTLKNSPILKEEKRILTLQVNEQEGLKQGDRQYSRAMISVIDKLFKPDWWSVNDKGSLDSPSNSVEEYYLGEYLEDKYKMFLDELKKDDVVFDGKDKQVLRKYALKLKNTLKNINAQRPPNDPLKDEKTKKVIEVPVAG